MKLYGFMGKLITRVVMWRFREIAEFAVDCAERKASGGAEYNIAWPHAAAIFLTELGGGAFGSAVTQEINKRNRHERKGLRSANANALP